MVSTSTRVKIVDWDVKNQIKQTPAHEIMGLITFSSNEGSG